METLVLDAFRLLLTRVARERALYWHSNIQAFTRFVAHLESQHISVAHRRYQRPALDTKNEIQGTI